MGKAVCKFLRIVILLMPVLSFAQIDKPPLERTITLDLSGHSTKETLKMIEDLGDLIFAYRSDVIESSNWLTRSYVNKTVREILDDIFQGKLHYKVKGNYVLLRYSPKLDIHETIIEGYVSNLQTGEKVPFVSIYDSVSLISTVSNEYGYFLFKVKNTEQFDIITRKIGYKDTIIQWNQTGKGFLNIKIEPISLVSDTVKKGNPSIIERLKNSRLFNLSKKKEANIDNINDTLTKKSQFSVIPYVGTYGELSANTIVDYSFNLFGGINKSVKKAEIGGLFNIVLDTVNGFQMSGLFNAVGGPQKGFQLAGFTNLNASSFKGVQLAGVCNSATSNVNGVQVAGLWNLKRGIDTSHIYQFAGLFNYATQIDKGLQASGFVNIAKNEFSGLQIAGFSNNLLSDSKGTQVAGFINTVSKNYEGVQVAGFINVANQIKGVQLGVINVSDSINGIPIGFLSFSRKGFHQLEISTNEVMPFNLAFKTGVNQFYNIFTVGIQPTGDYPLWCYGYGVGTSFSMGNKSKLFLDLQSHNIHRIESYSDFFNLHNKLTLSYHFQLFKHIAIAVGPSYNVLLVNEHLTPLGSQLKKIAPYHFYDKTTTNNMNIRMWIGGYLAIKFF